MTTKNFESVIIFTPVLSEEQLKDVVSRYRQLITEHGGEIVHEANWGLTRLAYPIQKKTTGFYLVVEYRAKPEFISELELQFKRDERILRFLTLSLDKHAVIYNDKRRRGEILPAKKIVKKTKGEEVAE